MRTFALFLIITALLYGDLFAQRTRVGIKAGINSSTLSEVDGSGYLLGFNGGGFARFGWPSDVVMQLEVLYSRQGASTDQGDFIYEYVQFPLVAKAYLGRRLNAQFGAQVGFRINAEAHRNGIEVDLTEQVEDFDFSWILGAGLDLRSGFSVDARFVAGVSNTADSFLIEEVQRNRMFQISVGYAFSNKRN